jgi:energy-coupling factor transporter ATP-binding protein EcfA2
MAMKISLASGDHKSLVPPFSWADIPQFAVITGPNGSGKTHLLELIEWPFRPERHSQRPRLTNASVAVDGATYKSDEVAFLNTFALPKAASSPPNAVGAAIADLLARIKNDTGPGGVWTDRRLAAARKILHEKSSRPVKELSESEIVGLLPPDIIIGNWEFSSLPSSIATLFHNYHIASIELRAGRKSEDDIEAAIGRAPWRILNELIETSGVNYRLTTPEKLGLRVPFELKLQATDRDVTLDFSALSSGEQVIVATYLWLYTGREYGVLPSLILLDEPDAHLHPSMIRGFIKSLNDILVKKHGCRIIMTTHRPDTVASAPGGSLFEMFRDGVRLRPVESPEATLGRLCSNLFTVIPGARGVLVEDNADVDFYRAALRLSQTLGGFPTGITPVFLSVGIGKGEGRVSGGKNKVWSWVEKLQEAEFGKLIQGIVDRDAGNPERSNVHLLPRYSIENYLVDPVVLYAALLDVGKAPDAGLKKPIHKGEEATIAGLPSEDLQRIAEAVLVVVEPLLADLTDGDKERVDVRFTSSKVLKYPRWLVEKRGHDLLGRICAELKPVCREALLSAFESIRMLPSDLGEMILGIV